ncbi:MAG: flagellar protein FlgN [Pseudomonadota bacterium]|nr:flagellar protein FlgN [Pseudomonadota bacterium]
MASPITTVRDEQQLISSLVSLMQQEQQFLVSADSDGLDKVTPQKSALVLQLAALANQRHQALAAAGFAAGEAGMAAWLASATDAAAAAAWNDLLDQTRVAKELNRVNGMLINKQMTNTQVVLNAMRTPAGGGEDGFYGPRGQTSVGGPSRRFVVG